MIINLGSTSSSVSSLLRVQSNALSQRRLWALFFWEILHSFDNEQGRDLTAQVCDWNCCRSPGQTLGIYITSSVATKLTTVC